MQYPVDDLQKTVFHDSVGMLKTERASEPNGRSHIPAEVVTTSSSPIIFTSQPLQLKNRKRDFQEDEGGPIPKIPRAFVRDNQEIAAVNENLLSPSFIETRDAATSPVSFSNNSEHSINLDTVSPALKVDDQLIPPNRLDFRQTGVVHGALTPPLSPNHRRHESDESEDWSRQAESDVEEKESLSSSSSSRSSSGSRSSTDSCSSSCHRSETSHSSSSRSRAHTRSRRSSVSSNRSQSLGSWPSRTHSSRLSSHHESGPSSSPRSESRTGSEISEHSFQSEARSDEYSQDERAFSIDSNSDDDEEQNRYFLVGPFGDHNILAEAEHILTVYSPPIEE